MSVTEPLPQHPTVTVSPIRTTPRMAEMERLFVALGLQPRLRSESGRWVDFHTGAGLVALHASETGGVSTTFSLELADPEATAAQLSAAGHDAVVVDEAYARAVTVTDPRGERLLLNGVQTDPYGYEHQPAAVPAPDLQICAIVYQGDHTAYATLLQDLGLVLRGEDTPEFAAYEAPGGGGVVGLHHGTGADEISFETRTPLEQVVDRLVAAGAADATLVRSELGDFVQATDPDGLTLQVHPLH